MDTQRYRSAIIGLFAAAGFALADGGTVAAQATYPLRYAVDTERNLNELSQRVAVRQGFFAREGIDLQLHRFVATGDRPADRSALVAARDSFDIARMQLSVLMEPQGRFRGMNYVAVAAVVNNPVYFLVARPEIKTFADLKGKKLTLPSATDPISLTAHRLMEMHGLKDGDVEIKDIAGSQPRVACLKSGDCAAASLAQPSVFAAFEAGADPRNREEVVKAAMEVTAQPENRAREMLSYFWDAKNDVLPQQGEIDLGRVNAMIGLFGRYGILKTPLPAPERFVDLRYLKMAGIQ